MSASCLTKGKTRGALRIWPRLQSKLTARGEAKVSGSLAIVLLIAPGVSCHYLYGIVHNGIQWVRINSTPKEILLGHLVTRYVGS